MSELYKVSNAEIVRPESTRLMRIVEYANPEILLPKLLQEYFLEIGFSSMYPNFKSIRISAVHPFALLLFQTVQGTQNLDLSVFPSITVSDSVDNEVFSELGRGFENVAVDAEYLAALLGGVDTGKLILSDDNRARLEAAVANGGIINGIKTSYRANHNVDLNIWSENKDLTSLIYDLVKHFIIGNIGRLHTEGFDVQNPITGRRSGDINVEFGRLLHGANVTLPLTIDTATMVFDTPVGVITTITPQPDYHVPGGA